MIKFFPTWAVDEGPVVFGLAGAHAGVESRLGAGGQAGQGGRGRDGGLEGPSIRALDALTFARVTGVGAPTAGRLVQTMAAGSVAGAVLRCSTTQNPAGFSTVTDIYHYEVWILYLTIKLGGKTEQKL